MRVVLAPTTGGDVVMTTDGADSGLGVLDAAADLEAVGAWLSQRGARA